MSEIKLTAVYELRDDKYVAYIKELPYITTQCKEKELIIIRLVSALKCFLEHAKTINTHPLLKNKIEEEFIL